MNLLEQAAGVWARKWVLLGGSLLVALAVFAVRSTAPEEYVATTTVQVRLPDTLTSDPASQVAFYAQTAGGLVTSRDVVAQALEDVDRAGEDVDDVIADISPSLGLEPGFVDVEVTGSTAEESVVLADALGAVLVDQVASTQAEDLAAQRATLDEAIADLGRERQEALDAGADNFQKAALDRQREALLGAQSAIAQKVPWRLAVVEPAVAPSAPSAPMPLRDALLALILALIIGAELIVAARAIRGSLSARDPGKDAGAAAGVPGYVVRPGQAATALTPLLPAVGAARTVSVVQSGRAPQARTAGLVAELLAVRGDSVLLVDAAVDRPSVHTAYDLELAPGLAELRQGDDLDGRLADLPRVRRVSVLPAGQAARSDDDRPLNEIVKSAPQARVTVAVSIAGVDDLMDVVADLDGPVVLDVDDSISKRELRTQAETLRGLGIDLVAVTVSTR